MTGPDPRAAEEARRRLEPPMRAAFAAAILLYATRGDSEGGQADSRLHGASLDAARQTVRAAARLLRGGGRSPELLEQDEQMAQDLAADIRRTAADQVRRRRARPTASPDRPWERRAAQAAATRHLAETSLRMARTGSLEPLGLRKVWISMGDPDVRLTHRRYHGQVRDLDQDFWRWPATGKRLAYPGDPRAPLDETVNCRCVLVFVPASESGTSTTSLSPADLVKSFDVVAPLP